MTTMLILAAATVFSGTTFIDKPIVLTPDDSGRVFEGKDGATISGGIRIVDWKDCGNGIWEAPAPRNADGSTMFFDQLWVNERRAPNSRVPNEGFFTVTNSAQTQLDAPTPDGWKFKEEALFAELTDELDDISPDDMKYVQMEVIVKWSFARRVLADYDKATRKATFYTNEKWPRWAKWDYASKEAATDLKNSGIVCFTNVRSGFDAPGEWFLDMKAAKVLYRPLPGEKLSSFEPIVPRYGQSQLVIFKGDPAAGKFIENVTFRNLTFANSSFTPNSTAKGGPCCVNQYQAAQSSDGTIQLFGARNCRFENCRFAHTGNYGMRFGSGCMSNSVVNCTLEDLGAGGIWMGEDFGNHEKGEPRKGPKITRKIILPDVPTAVAFNLISNCTIRAAGKYNPEGTAVAMAHVSDSKVLHCDIYDILYSGISVGWIWGYSGSVAQRNEIAYNHIYDLGKHIMSDMGGIYTLGTSFGTKVHDNIVHDVWSYSYGGWALYCDEGSEGIVMERNLCYNTTDGGMHQHYGVGCVIRNNIFAFNRYTGAVRTRRQIVEGIPSSMHFVNNIIMVREGPLACTGICGVGGIWANNLWYDQRGISSAKLDRFNWDAWCKNGKETGSRFADPKFLNADNFDFRLQPDSPAFALGFKAWDYGVSGRK